MTQKDSELNALAPSKDTIGMSMHFNDADPVAVCLVIGCGQHFHGDSRNDAMTAWSEHVSKHHREDWDRCERQIQSSGTSGILAEKKCKPECTG